MQVKSEHCQGSWQQLRKMPVETMVAVDPGSLWPQKLSLAPSSQSVLPVPVTLVLFLAAFLTRPSPLPPLEENGFHKSSRQLQTRFLASPPANCFSSTSSPAGCRKQLLPHPLALAESPPLRKLQWLALLRITSFELLHCGFSDTLWMAALRHYRFPDTPDS